MRRTFVFCGWLCCCGGAADHAAPQDAGLSEDALTADSFTASVPRSCAGRTDTCGSSANDDCCAFLSVTGGSFLRNNDGVTSATTNYPATISTFRLDKYEITVARVRAFVVAYPSSKPAAGAGAHPKVPGSGWQDAWPLAPDQSALRSDLSGGTACSRTWTDAPANNENKPINCLTWYELAAFCAWDGGRLPTDAEWHFAASAGSEQRVYPWSQPPTSTNIDSNLAVYSAMVGDLVSPERVGSRPSGGGKWGHLDIAGNVAEWLLDGAGISVPCVDCAFLATPGDPRHVVRGGDYGDTADIARTVRSDVLLPGDRREFVGGRCARDM